MKFPQALSFLPQEFRASRDTPYCQNLADVLCCRYGLNSYAFAILHINTVQHIGHQSINIAQLVCPVMKNKVLHKSLLIFVIETCAYQTKLLFHALIQLNY